MSTEDEKESNVHDSAEAPANVAPANRLGVEEERIWKLEGFDHLPLTMSVPVVGSYLGVSKSTAYNLCKAGTIRTRRFGERISVTRYELFRLLHGPESSTAVA